MLNVPVIVFVLIIVLTNYFFTRWFIRYAKVKRITDIPSERSSHVTPTPRGGGIGFVITVTLGFFVYLIFWGSSGMGQLITFLGVISLISLLGWFDDRKDLSRRFRLGVQLISALVILFIIANLNYMTLPYTGSVYLGFAGTLMGMIWIIGTTNIYNFMDGVDGLSSVQAIFAAVGWGLFFYLNGESDLFVLNFFLLAGIGAFIALNWPPAKIFMGDVGSLYLGFLFAAMPFLAAAVMPAIEIGDMIWFAAILLWPFLYDGSFTIIRRLINGENIFEAHRSHLYQRLNIIGWPHNSISILYALFSFLTLNLAHIYLDSGDEVKLSIIIILVLLSFVYSFMVKRAELNRFGENEK